MLTATTAEDLPPSYIEVADMSISNDRFKMLVGNGAHLVEEHPVPDQLAWDVLTLVCPPLPASPPAQLAVCRFHVDGDQQRYGILAGPVKKVPWNWKGTSSSPQFDASTRYLFAECDFGGTLTRSVITGVVLHVTAERNFVWHHAKATEILTVCCVYFAGKCPGSSPTGPLRCMCMAPPWRFVPLYLVFCSSDMHGTFFIRPTQIFNRRIYHPEAWDVTHFTFMDTPKWMQPDGDGKPPTVDSRQIVCALQKGYRIYLEVHFFLRSLHCVH